MKFTVSSPACARALALVCAVAVLMPTASSAALTHRWSFNGDLTDSVGGQTAQILDPDNNPATGGAATLGPNAVTLAGGANLQSSYIELGPDVLGTGPGTTLELWATQITVQNWSRIFDLGSSAEVFGDASVIDTFIMSWTRGTQFAQDRIEFRLSTSAPNGAQGLLFDDSNAPYELNTEYHIVMTLENSNPDFNVLTWYSAPSGAADLGPARGSLFSSIDITEFNDAVAWLGRSHWSGDATANASFNEFRTYDAVLTESELETNHDLGPNQIPEPSAMALAALCGIGFLSRRRRR